MGNRSEARKPNYVGNDGKGTLMVANRVLVVDLLSGIWSHTLLLNKTVQALSLEGVDVDYLTCGSAFETHCTVKESKRRLVGDANKYRKLDCMECNFSGSISSRHLKSSNVNIVSNNRLSDFLDDKIESMEKKAVRECLDSRDWDYLLHGTPVAKFALFETVIKFKKLNLDFTDKEMEFLTSSLSNVIRTTLIARKFLETNRPSIAICHTPEYGVNNAFLDQCIRAGVTTYGITNSSNLSEMTTNIVLWNHEDKPGLTPALRTWPGFESFRKRSDDESRLNKHFRQISLANSPFVYSVQEKGLSPNQIRSLLDLPSGRKIVVLALSSTDEVIASKQIGRNRAVNYPGSVFQDQFDWVQQTIQYFSKRQDIVLVVRLHPRDMPNKRESVKSEQFSRWLDLLEHLPSNVRINLPEQKISFGDLCGVMDVLVTGWSSVALEAMIKGIPAVTYDFNLPSYPHDIHFSGETREQFFSNVEAALEVVVPSTETAVRARSWLAHSLNHITIPLSGRLFENLRTNGSRVVRIFFSAMERYLFWMWRPLEMYSASSIPESSKTKIGDVLFRRRPGSYDKEREIS